MSSNLFGDGPAGKLGPVQDAIGKIRDGNANSAACKLCRGARVIDQYAIDFAARTRKHETVACPECGVPE